MSKKRRLFNEIFNAAMCALVLLPALIIIEKLLLPKDAPWRGVLLMLPAALCYPAGRLLRSRERQSALSLGAVISAAAALPAAIAYAGKISVLATIFVFLLVAACGVAMYLIPYISGSNLANGKFFVAGLLLYVAALALGGENAASYSAALNTCAVVLLVCGLFVFNLESLRSATAPGGGKARFPKGMRRSNMIILGIFVLLALGLANIRAIKDAVVAAAYWVRDAIMSFFQSSEPGETIVEPIPSAVSGGDLSSLVGSDYHKQTALSRAIWNIVLYILIAALVVLVCFLIYKFIKRLLARFGGFFDKLLGRIAPQEESFVDETEDIDGEQGERDPLFVRIRERFRPKEKFSDMKSPRAKVRFAYREFLRKHSAARRSSTPNELAPELKLVATDFTADYIEAYNRARYSREELGEEEAEMAQRIVERLR